jgi:hypothetical protein
MTTVRFNPNIDLAPLPLKDPICEKAMQMKAAGLKWQPYVGCFV